MDAELSRNLVLPIAVALATLVAGCQPPQRAVKYPEGALQVRYESSTSYSGCLAASTAMAANYLLGESRYSEAGITKDMKAARLDETRVGDVKQYLQGRGLYLLSLVGRTGDKPPDGVGYWVKKRGYPVICVINREASGDTAFNHAVVVIGISAKQDEPSTDIIHYFDPATRVPLQALDASRFDSLWARGEHAMMMVVAPPADSRPASQ